MTGSRFLSAREVAGQLAIPWRDLEPALVQAGVRIVRLTLPGGGRRVRVDAEGLARYLAESSRPELPAADRAELAVQMAVEELGLTRRTRKEHPR